MTNTFAAVATFVAIVTAFIITGMIILTPTPAASAEMPTYIDEMAFAFWGGSQRAQAEDVDALQVIDAQADRGDLVVDEPGTLPIFGRTQFAHINKFCEEEQNPPEGWLRPNGFCGLTDQMAKGSLMYQGADYNFGFKGK